MEKKLFIPIFLITVLLTLQPSMFVHAQGSTIISITNVGDDKGPGYYGYPTADVFKSGVFQITKFEVINSTDSLIFKVYFKDLGDNPWNGPNGFCLQYTQIYIRTTRTDIPFRMDTFGLNIALRNDYGWQYALLLAPGWGSAPVPADQKAALYYSNGTAVVQNNSTFKVYADTTSNAVVAQVSNTLLSDLGNIANWKIVVGVASYDGFGPMRVRTAGIKGGQWNLNATATAPQNMIQTISKAISMGIEPRVLDLVVYSPEYPNGITADLQHQWLNSFDPTKGLLATVPSLPAVTSISTTTSTTVSTSITTTTSIQTTVSTDWTTTSILGVVLLIVGIAIGYVIRRPRKA